MNVIILNGGIKWPMVSRSVGPYKIAHWIRKYTSKSVQVIDFVDKLKYKHLDKLLKKFVDNDTHVIAISTTFLSNRIYKTGEDAYRLPEYVIDVIKEFKAKYPKIRVVTGGYLAERIPHHDIIDDSIMSYTEASEDVFLEYINHLMDGTEPPIGEMVSPILATGTDQKSRMFYHTARNKVYNIEYDDFKWTKNDCIIPGEPLPLDISKGCIFACSFCQYPHIGKKKFDYIRAMEYIEEELLENYKNFQTTSYYLLDDTFNDSEYKLKLFHDMVKRLPFEIKFSAYLRADLIHRFPDMAHLLKDAGLKGAYHGIESLHPEASRIVGKGWNGKQDAREFLPRLYHDLWKGEVAQHLNFIAGLPQDTYNSLMDTVSWFKDNNLHSINFNALGVYGKSSSIAGRHSTQSDFDANLEKYGFEITGELPSGLILWKNGGWTNVNAAQMTRKLQDLTIPLRKSHSWRVLPYYWHGIPESDIFSLTDGELLKHPDVLPTARKHLIYYYYSLLSL